MMTEKKKKKIGRRVKTARPKLKCIELPYPHMKVNRLLDFILSVILILGKCRVFAYFIYY